CRTLGRGFVAANLTLADLQRHVNERSRKKYRGKKLSPVTLKKEVASLRAAWNWVANIALLKVPFLGRGLVYPQGRREAALQDLAGDRAAGGRPRCRCPGATASATAGCPRRCGCRPRRGCPRCRPGAGSG